ncbi:hypothetical protein [Rathayibacter sp. AY1D2]|uniref:hypothetical protein n=1 Tax=Rathayibacter sp. AY1D2 TaxID=2080543 RepID=UPI0011B02668|nr:hypothetical protein [Rathayibacter sp. AY1D2]
MPWLIGRHLLRDSIFRVRDTEVFDVAARNDGDYFMTDWLSGCVVVMVITALIMLRPSWSRRVLPVATGALIASISALLLVPQAAALWSTAEAATVARLAAEAYPMAKSEDVCGSTGTTVTDATGVTHNYQMYAVAGCSKIEVFDGWTRVGQFSLPTGARFGGTDGITGSLWTNFDPFESGSAETSGALLQTTVGTSVGLTYANPAGAWTLGGAANVYDANLALITLLADSAEGRLVGISPASGQKLWSIECPVPGQVMRSAGLGSFNSIGMNCLGEPATGDTGSRNYDIDPSGIILNGS